MNTDDNIAAALYEMGLLDVLTDSEGAEIITRVPGGWLFTLDMMSTVFVPFNSEFMPVHQKQASMKIRGH